MYEANNRKTTSLWWLPVLLAIIGVVVLLTVRGGSAPQEGSAEAGFARDMIVHHAQAVEMSQLLYDRTEHDALKSIALDIMLTQQSQIGQMQGWLNLWGLPFANPGLPMAWMDMPTEGIMPGMATDEQLAALRASSGTEADRLFIHLMIAHHEAGIHMAEAVFERTSVEAVRDLARSMIDAQEREIAELEIILAEIGAEPAAETEVEATPTPHAH